MYIYIYTYTNICILYTIILHFLVVDAFRDHCFFWQQNKKQREKMGKGWFWGVNVCMLVVMILC